VLNKNTIQQFEREYIPLTEQEPALQQKPAHYTVGKFITSLTFYSMFQLWSIHDI